MRDHLTSTRVVQAVADGGDATLIVNRPDGATVSWRREGDRLIRRERSVVGLDFQQAFSLRVVRFGWREVRPGLVEVRLARRVAAVNPFATGGVRTVERETVRVEALQVALRGAAGGGW